jgi:hypothetical protein
VIDAACELAHAAQLKIKAKVIVEVVVPISLLRGDGHEEYISSCCHHARLEQG